MKKLTFFTLLLMLFNMPMLYSKRSIRMKLIRPKDFVAPLDWALPFRVQQLRKLLDDVESGELQKKYSADEIDHINKYLAVLVEKGISPNQLEKDGVPLSDINSSIGVYPLKDYFKNVESSTSELIGTREPHIIQRIGKKIWRFVKRHKKKIITGAVVVGGVFAAKKYMENGGDEDAETALNALSSGALTAAAGVGSSLSKDNSSKENQDTFVSPKLEKENTPSKTDHTTNHFTALPNPTGSEVFSSPVQNSFLNNTSQTIKRPESCINSPINTLANTLAPPSVDMSTQEGPLFSYAQSVNELTLAIDRNPVDPWLYVERGIVSMQAEQYETSLQDFDQFTKCIEDTPRKIPFSTPDFVCGFARGFPKGVYESGEHTFLFVSDFVKHPIHTGIQLYDAFSTLAGYVYQSEWETIGKVLSPELHQLLTEWETLPTDKRGELAGYCVGKNGTDLLTPAVIAKVASKSAKAGRALSTFAQKVKKAKKVLYLEAAVETGNIGAYSAALKVGERAVFLGEELGVSVKEMSLLKQAGKLESTLQKKFHHLSLPKQQMIDFFEKVQLELKPFRGKYMPEWEIKELIHKTGLSTFQKPVSIPENFRVKLSNTGGGIKYVHPLNEGTYVRVMPGKPHSPNLYQRMPYVVHQKDGKALDKFGNIVSKRSREAHIPLEEYVYIGD